jgi:branched-subunit amino acid aminotransferase/4-amino-4-deoxychorismate lyase
MSDQSSLQISFLNGTFENIEKVQTPIDSLAVNRAYAAYEFLRINQSKPFYLERHLDRFFRTLEIMRLSIAFQRNEIEQIITDLIEKNGASDFYLKLFAIPETSHKQINQAAFYITPFQFKDYPDEMYQNGANLIMKEYSRFLPEAKTTNYVASAYWQYEMDSKNAIDVLYFSGNEVFETSRGNLFLVKGNNIYTPDKQILKGITRSIVIDLVKDKYILSEQAISVRDIFWADEVFITSTTKRIMPVVNINNSEIGNGKVGKISKDLLLLYNQELDTTKLVV